jgi:hypothetical protein
MGEDFDMSMPEAGGEEFSTKATPSVVARAVMI